MGHKYNSVKHPAKSKTLWVNLIMAAVAFFPSVQTAIAANPEYVPAAIGAINAVLRFVTKDRLSLRD